MSDDQFTKLFNYVSQLDIKLDKVIETMVTKDEHNQLIDLIDGYAAKLDTYAQEMAAMDHKMRRLEKYIEVLAEKAGVDLQSIKV